MQTISRLRSDFVLSRVTIEGHASLEKQMYQEYQEFQDPVYISEQRSRRDLSDGA